MPIIPDQIARVNPQVQKTMSTQDPRLAGRGMQAVADLISDVQESRTKYQLSQASTEFQIAKAQQDHAYDNDEDYRTIEERYTKSLQEALDSSSNLISDGRARNEFVNRAQVAMAQGQARISQVAWGKEVDYQRTYLQDKLRDLREAGVTGSLADATDSVESLVDSAVEMDYISAEEGSSIYESWRTDTTQGYLRTLDPSERLNVLSSPVGKNLPTDVRMQLQEEAQTEAAKVTAINNVDSYFDANVDANEALRRIRDIQDPEVRTETERRYTNERNRRTTAETDTKVGIHQEYFLPVRTGEMSVDDIPRSAMQNMTPNMINSLYAAEANASARTRKTSDRTVIDTLYALKAAGDRNALREYFIANADKLDDTDFETWSEATYQVPSSAVESTLSDQQYINQVVDELRGPDKGGSRESQELASRMKREWETYSLQYQDMYSRRPTDLERNQFIDRQVMQLPTRYNRGALGTVLDTIGRGIFTFAPDPAGSIFTGGEPSLRRERTYLEMSPEEKTESMLALQKGQPDVTRDVLSILGVENMDQVRNPDDFFAVYQEIANAP